MYDRNLRDTLGTWARVVGTSMSLTTAPIATPIRRGVSTINCWCASAWQLKLCPRPTAVFKSIDSGVTFTDYTSQATDGNPATVISMSDFPLTTGFFYVILPSDTPMDVGCALYNGLWVDVVTANGTTSTLTCKYWKGSWTSLSITDNTVSSSKTLAIDGTITWTAVTDATKVEINGKTGYVLRFEVSATLDDDVTLGNIVVLTADTGAYLAANTVYDFAVHPSIGGLEGVHATSGTAYVNFIYGDRP